MSPNNPSSVIGQTFAEASGETVEFFDFYAKPVAGTPPGTASTFTIEESEFAFQLSGSQGILQTYNGDGMGGGTWTPTAFTIPLATSRQAKNWVRLTARLDFTRQRWDLYANSQIVAADIPFISASTYLSSFQLQGDVSTISGLDDILVGPANPLFADANSNGIDDAWETAHSLSLSSDNRSLDIDGDGLTTLQEYLAGSDPQDYYNGVYPSLAVYGGDRQTIGVGEFNAEPFDVAVWVSDSQGWRPLVDAPVTFTVVNGGGLLAVSPQSSVLSTTFVARTDNNGRVTVYYKQPGIEGTQSLITASVDPAGQLGATFVSGSTASSTYDSDGDGMPDVWENKRGTNPTQNDANADPDGDGFANYNEFKNDTNPFVVDTPVQALYSLATAKVTPESESSSSGTKHRPIRAKMVYEVDPVAVARLQVVSKYNFQRVVYTFEESEENGHSPNTTLEVWWTVWTFPTIRHKKFTFWSPRPVTRLFPKADYDPPKSYSSFYISPYQAVAAFDTYSFPVEDSAVGPTPNIQNLLNLSEGGSLPLRPYALFWQYSSWRPSSILNYPSFVVPPEYFLNPYEEWHERKVPVMPAIDHPVVGTLVQTRTGGDDYQSYEAMSTDMILQKLRAASYNFSEFKPLKTMAEAFFYFSDAATVRKMKYKFSLAAGFKGRISWMETFTPYGGQQYTDFRILSYDADGIIKETPEYTVDPIEDNNPHRFLCVAGKYEVKLLDIGLVVDANRDSVVTPASFDPLNIPACPMDFTSAADPFRFWLNDDIDSGDVANGSDSHDIPGQTAMLSSGFGPDYLTDDLASGLGDAGSVRGVRDLVDYFPVFLDIKQLLTALPPSDTVKYKLKQADGAVNFVYTNLTRATAFDYQRNLLTTGFGRALSQAPQGATKYHITATGVDLFSGIIGSSAFLDAIQNHDGGVILIDGRVATTQPLVLSVEKSDGTVIAEVKLELRISSVEQMFRHINLRDGADAASGLVGQQRDTGPATRLDNPVDAFSDTSTDQPWFIFVVGSNVGGQNSRGWESEVFKRMYWSHSKARFVGVSWFGDPYSDGDDLLYDYHSAARNAFATAPALTAKINALPGSKTIAGHSAACLMISSAIADYGLSVNNACLIDAAMARECFDGSSADDLVGMAPAVWRDYPSSLWASHWYERFDSTDARSTLTWRNRFNGAAGVVHNFYSSTEDVLGRYEGTVDGSIIENVRAPGAFAWTIQEKAKGDKLRIGWFIHAGSDYGGWGFNLNDPLTINLPTWYVPNNNAQRVAKTPDQIGSVTTQMLSDIKIQPLFKTGWGRYYYGNPAVTLVDTDPTYYTGPDWIFDLYGPTAGNAVAADPAKRTQLLNEAIPALSLAVGSNRTDRIGDTRNYDMPSQYASAVQWPSARGASLAGVPNWHHSDMREIAYFYIYKFYDKLSSLSNQ